MPRLECDFEVLTTTQDETAILRAILQDNAIYSKVAECLDSQDFSSHANRSVFVHMKELAETQEAISIKSLSAAFDRHDEPNDLVGREFLESLGAGSVPDLEENLRVVKRKSALRRVIAICTSTIRQALDDNVSATELARFAEQQMFEVGNGNVPESLQKVEAIITSSFGSVENLYKRGQGVMGLATGFTALDQLTGGLQKGHLTVIAALPGMGKAAFAMNIARNAALRQDAVVAFFCGEICKEDLVLRMLVSEAWVDQRRLETGFLLRDDYEKLQRTLNRIIASQMFLDDAIGMSLAEIQDTVLRLKRRAGALDLIVINGFEMITWANTPVGKNTGGRTKDMSRIIHGLKFLAKEVNVPIVVLAELSPRVENGLKDNRPRLIDLTASDPISRSADLVIFIHRESHFRREEEMSEAEQARAEIIVARNRSGPAATVYLNFISRFARFENPDL